MISRFTEENNFSNLQILHYTILLDWEDLKFLTASSITTSWIVNAYCICTLVNVFLLTNQQVLTLIIFKIKLLFGSYADPI